MSAERREHEREAVSAGGDDARFSLKAGSRDYAFTHVHDVSISGAGVVLPEPIDIGTPVTLTFDSDEIGRASCRERV